MKSNSINFLYKVIFLFVIFIGCKDDITVADLDDRDLPSVNLLFGEHIQPILSVKCSNSGCHNDQDRAGSLSLTNWSSVVADPGVVFPFEPQNSRLVWSIEGQSGTQPMPPIGYPPLSIRPGKNQIEAIKQWIREGAKNN